MLGDLRRYQDLLNFVMKRGYRIVPLETVIEQHGSAFVAWLRHDVEIDLKSAQLMARAEAEMSIPSTYYLCFDSPFFFGKEDALFDCVRNLQAMGRDVQPHIDLNKIASFDTQAVGNQAYTYSEKFGFDLKSLTFHAPGVDVATLASIARVPWIYEMIHRENAVYLSDSGDRWKWGSPFEDKRINVGFVLQLLIHPAWWNPEINVPQLISSVDKVDQARIKRFLPEYAKGIFDV